MERTFAMIKPDAVQRGLVGEIVGRFEKKGIKIVAMKLMQVPRELAEKHYEIHKGKPFYPPLIEYITSGPVVPMVLEGDDVITVARRMMGATNPKQGAPGEMRFDFGQQIGRNIIHGSDSPETAKFEIGLWFGEELAGYTKIDAAWLYE
ncbi:MAG: nucleoside-diphosphate kinase [Thermoplasmata archaeon HGW-Thermoplasmata-1]|nr:MAG: nucleoside-diphosphate kinase [Thermoplasmata archaeon HGW-Thermoplasmata-1]